MTAAGIQALQERRQGAVHRQHLGGTAFGAGKVRQGLVFDLGHAGAEDLALLVHELVAALIALPQRRRLVFFDVDHQLIGPDAAHHGVAHPGHGFKHSAGALQVDGEEVARNPRHGVGTQAAHGVAGQFTFELNAANGQPWRTREPQHRSHHQRQTSADVDERRDGIHQAHITGQNQRQVGARSAGHAHAAGP